MKILMTTDNIGGVWTFATDLATGLNEKGMEVFLAITGNPITEAQKFRLRDIKYFFKEYRQEWMDDPWDDIELTGQWLMDLKHEIDPDIAHLNAYSSGNLDWDIPVVMTLHSCVLTWWDAVRKEEIPSCWDTYRVMVGSGLMAADMITAPSLAMLQSAEGKYGDFSEKQVIYNGRDPGLFQAAEKEKIVFSMGRLWDEAKNIHLILEAAPNIRYPVYIAGDNAKFQTPVSIPENVTLLGQLDPKDVAEWLSRSSVYLLPAVYEPFGYTFLEAAFSHCTLVGGDIQTLREIWNGSMVLVDTSNSKTLADTVNDLMENVEKRKKLSEKSYRRAMQKFQIHTMVENYARLYSGIYSQLSEKRPLNQEHEN